MESRALAAIDSPPNSLRTFDASLQDKVNALSQSILEKLVFPNYRLPAKYTGELFGVEYLYHQSGITFDPGDDLDTQIDEGFVDLDADAGPVGEPVGWP